MTDTQTQVGGKWHVIHVGHRMTIARDTASLSLERAADELGISKTTLISYEKGRTLPKPGAIKDLAALTQHNLQWLITGTPGTETNAKSMLKKVALQRKSASLCISARRASPIVQLDRFRRRTSPSSKPATRR